MSQAPLKIWPAVRTLQMVQMHPGSDLTNGIIGSSSLNMMRLSEITQTTILINHIRVCQKDMEGGKWLLRNNCGVRKRKSEKRENQTAFYSFCEHNIKHNPLVRALRVLEKNSHGKQHSAVQMH